MINTFVDKKTTARLCSIDALRGLAALVIVIFHARPMFWVGVKNIWDTYGMSLNINAILGYLTIPLSFGGFAVDLFFVLSGYSLHRKGAFLLANNPDFELDKKKYFIRRFSRIYPVYFAALVLTAIVHLWVKNQAPSLVEGQDNSIFTFIMSLLSLQGIFAPSFAHNSVFWYLAIQIHLYLIYPLIFHLVKKFDANILLTIFAFLSFTYIAFDAYFNFNSALFPYKGSGGPLFIPYLFTWGIGIYLAQMEAKGITINLFNISKFYRCKNFQLVLMLTLFFGSLGIVTNSILTLLQIIVISIACGFIIYISKSEKGEIFWSKSIGKPCAFLGMFSFSLYAVHRPFLLLFKLYIDPLDQKSYSLLPVLVSVLFCLVFSLMFFYVFEKRSLTSKISKSSLK